MCSCSVLLKFCLLWFCSREVQEVGEEGGTGCIFLDPYVPKIHQILPKMVQHRRQNTPKSSSGGGLGGSSRLSAHLGRFLKHLGGLSGRLGCVLGRHRRVLGGVLERAGAVLGGLQEAPRAS